MRYDFTEDDLKEEVNKIYIEDDDVLLECEFITGEGKNYILTGQAVIEGERYHDFQIEVELSEEPEEKSARSIIERDWEWYDYLC
jgi:hypothetical protein